MSSKVFIGNAALRERKDSTFRLVVCENSSQTVKMHILIVVSNACTCLKNKMLANGTCKDKEALFKETDNISSRALLIHSTLNGQNMKIHCPTLIKYSYCMIC